jgi:hypothetical protein
MAQLLTGSSPVCPHKLSRIFNEVSTNVHKDKSACLFVSTGCPLLR